MYKPTLNSRERIACQEYVAGGCKSFPEAMVKAKFAKSTAKHNSSIKLAKPAIQAEISRLLEPRRQKAGYDREASEAEAEQVRLRALEKDDLAACNQAIGHKAKLYGLLIDRREHRIEPFRPPIEPQARKAWLKDQLEALTKAEAAPLALATSPQRPRSPEEREARRQMEEEGGGGKAGEGDK